MNDTIRIGVVGTGHMAEVFISSIGYVPGLKVTAISSSNIVRAQTFAQTLGVQHWFGSSKELVDCVDVDAVYVANKTAGHFEAALEALSFKKPVLVEKPLTSQYRDAQKLIETAREYNCLLVENLWCMALPSYRQLFDDVLEGSYGKAVSLQFDFGYPEQRSAYPSLFNPKDAGALRDRGVYGISLALKLFGPIQNLCCRSSRDEAGADLATSLLMSHVSGEISQITVALNALLPNEASIACSKGLLRLKTPVIGSERLHRQRTHTTIAQPAIGRRQFIVARLRRSSTLRWVKSISHFPRSTFLSYGDDQYAPILRHFRDLIKSGVKESDLIPMDLSLKTQEILETAHIDSKNCAA